MAFPTIDHDYADRNQVPTPGYGKTIQAVPLSVTMQTAALAVNQVSRVGILPAGFTITGGYIEIDDLDTGGSPSLGFDMGIADPTDSSNDDADLFADGENTGQAGGKLVAFESAAIGFTTVNETNVTFETKAAAATAASGTLAITILGYFA